MKRDMETVRRLLIAVEGSEGYLQIKDPEEAFHVAWMLDAGLVQAVLHKSDAFGACAATVERLTWAGCEFLDAARNDTVWRTAKEKMFKPGVSWTFSLLSEVLKALAKQQLAHAGLPVFTTPEV
jgi:hypothetical protein